MDLFDAFLSRRASDCVNAVGTPIAADDPLLVEAAHHAALLEDRVRAATAALLDVRGSRLS